MQVFDGGIADVVEVVGQNLRRESHGNSLSSLSQQQREFSRQRDGLLVAAVVGELPFGGLRIEHHVERKLRQACLDVSRGSGAVAREDVSPVSLRVDEQVFLSHLHQGVADGGIAVGVELHGVAHDVGHLVVASVIHALHGVQDASLHGLQSVLDMGHGTLQDHVGGIVEKPILVHAAQMVHGSCIKTVHGLIVGVFFGCGNIFCFVVHDCKIMSAKIIKIRETSKFYFSAMRIFSNNFRICVPWLARNPAIGNRARNTRFWGRFCKSLTIKG